MRTRASVAVVTGAMALSALTVPAVQAQEQDGDVAISNVVINSGKPVVVGTTAAKKFTVTFTASDNDVIDAAFVELWRGDNTHHRDGFIFPQEKYDKTCKKAAISTCKATFIVKAGDDLYENADAGNWKLDLDVSSADGSSYDNDNVKSLKIQRAAKLTIKATPQPIRKGKTLTVTGALTRASWEYMDDGKYLAYSGQSVKLQYRKKDAKTYTDLKTVKTDKKGKLKTTVKATADGYYRFSFAGTTTTGAKDTAGDLVDVR